MTLAVVYVWALFSIGEGYDLRSATPYTRLGTFESSQECLRVRDLLLSQSTHNWKETKPKLYCIQMKEVVK